MHRAPSSGGVFPEDLLPTCHSGRRKAGWGQEQRATPLNIREQFLLCPAELPRQALAPTRESACAAGSAGRSPSAGTCRRTEWLWHTCQ